MRGKAHSAVVHGLYGGITPACAGKRRTARSARSASWDHPRVCGEKSWICFVGRQAAGSPPRVRGKAWQRPSRPFGAGITPACAGKRVWQPVHIGHAWDHPRVCGEKFNIKRAIIAHIGSPPRVRGKGRRCSGRCNSRRITPACAGKRNSTRQLFFPTWDHPRVCGEKHGRPCNIQPTQGSPPRVRGKVCDATRSCAADGITPACAGKRIRRAGRSLPSQDHPRVCGEKAKICYCVIIRAGSPPRVRGKEC